MAAAQQTLKGCIQLLPTTAILLALIGHWLRFSPLALSAAVPTCSGRTVDVYRTLDGSCNNKLKPLQGAAGTLMRRHFTFANLQSGVNQPNERMLSQTLLATEPAKRDCQLTFQERRLGMHPEPRGLNMMSIIWGQFFAHDTEFIPTPFNVKNPARNFGVTIPGCNDSTIGMYDELCVDNGSGVAVKMLFTRDSGGAPVDGIFMPKSDVSSYLDLNPVYGNDQATLAQLRLGAQGKLKTEPGDRLPIIKNGTLVVASECALGSPIAEGSHATGDARADQNFILTLIHTLWLREHNFRAQALAELNPDWDDEKLFQEARKLTIALFQHIVYDEWAPAMFGTQAVERYLGEYSWYDEQVDATIPVEHATAAFRFHTMLNLPHLTVGDNCALLQGNPQKFCRVPYKIAERQSCDATVFRQYPLEAHLRGALLQSAQKYDNKITDALRNLRIGSSVGNVDVEASNIFRGRLHSLPFFNDLRKSYGLRDLYGKHGCAKSATPGGKDTLACFKRISGGNDTLAGLLADIYGTVDTVDSFIGFNSEAVFRKGSVGRSATVVVLTTMRSLRAGDRFWYEAPGVLRRADRAAIKKTKLADLLRRHFKDVTVPDEAFFTSQIDTCRDATTSLSQPCLTCP